MVVFDAGVVLVGLRRHLIGIEAAGSVGGEQSGFGIEADVVGNAVAKIAVEKHNIAISETSPIGVVWQ